MTLKINELRIGNIVLINGKEIIMDSKMFHAVIHGFPGYEPEPILITSDILIKFGFEKWGGGWMKKYPIWINENRTQLQFDGIERDLIHCKCVHQLQNLYFTLTGEELYFMKNIEDKIADSKTITEKLNLSDAVDYFSKEMKNRLWDKVEEGKESWDTVSTKELFRGLEEKYEQYCELGLDPEVEIKLLIDISNFCMMLHKAIKEGR